MFNTPTINRYLTRIFLGYFLITLLVIVGVIVISNAFDTLQRFKSSNLDAITFWQMIAYKTPHILNETSTLIGFFSTVLFLRRITLSNELHAIISHGLQSWRVYLVPVITTFTLGFILFLTLSPLSSLSMIKYEEIENMVTNKPKNSIVISQTGIFFYENYEESHRIIRASTVSPDQNKLTNLTILIVDSENNFLKRIDAPIANLVSNQLELNNATITDKVNFIKNQHISLPTNLTIASLVQRFVPPELIPIWNLRSTINKFAKSGLSTVNYEVYFYKQLFKPLVMAAMVLIACWYISLNVRAGASTKIMFMAVILGLTAFFFIEISARILAHGGLDPLFACLLPAVGIILVSNFVILHFQEA